MKRIRLYFSALLLVCAALQINAQLTPKTNQQVNKCGAAEIHEQLMITDPGYAQKMQQFESYMQTVPANLNKTSSIVYRVPVVVNVMHKGEAVGVGSNVSDAEIQNAIKIMNQMYRKEAGTQWNGSGVDVEIEYVLAVRDPNGNCTNGINRISMTGNSAYMSDGVNRNASGGISDAALKAVFAWDQTQYYNIWLVYEIDDNEGGSGIQGYAYFASAHGQSYDGAVILASNFTSGTSTTAAHEIGHSLNLYHTFEGDGTGSSCPSASNGCGSGVGDCCGDIPAHARSTSDCTSGTNACDGTTSRDLFIHNYMDYSSDVCQNMLTANQKSRMILALTTTRATFLGPEYGGTNMALEPVTTAGVDFESSASILCGTGQSVKFTDRSTCIPNSYLSTSSFSGITHSWTITNGTTTYTSNIQNPTITFNNSGTYNVTLQITNANGTTSSTQTGMIIVTSGAPVAGCTPTSSNAGNFWQTIYNTSFNTFSSTTSKYINAAYTNNACTYNTIVTAGSSYPLSISANAEGGSGNENFEVYIDYNNDGVFTNPSEMIFSGVATVSTSATFTTNITIPGTAVQNTLLRMRVIGEMGALTSSDRTCGGPLLVGDVEDFGIYIKPAGCSAPTITGSTPSSRCGTGTLTIGATASAGTVNWYTAATGGTAIATGNSFTTPSLSSTAVYYVDATDAGCTTSSRTSVTASVTPEVVPGIAIALTGGTNPKCSGTTSTFTATPTNGGTTPSYQWKVNGSNVGTNSSTYTASTITNGQAVTCVLTSNANCAAQTTATSSAVTMTVNPTLVPSVAIALTGGANPKCSGTTSTFTATPTNGGTTPSYQWKVNGSNVGTNSSTYTTSTITNGQAVTCVLTSNANCAAPTTATSSAVTMTVNATVVPGVVISQTGGSNPLCTGSSATFTATATNGGTTPSYQWKVNGSNVGSNSSTYNNSGLTNGQTVSCILTSNATCAAPTTATSSIITMTVNSTVSPGITIAQTSGANPMCTGSSSTFTATASNGGTSPIYQWMVNGVNVGANSSTYANGGLSNGDDITCMLTSNLACANTPSAVSSAITMTVNTSPSVSANASPSSICAGSTTTLTASGATTYNWNTGGSTSSIIVSPGITTSYSVTGTNSFGCSNTDIVTVTVNALPNVSANANPSTICSGSSSTLSASGATTYNWNTGGSTSSIIVSPVSTTIYSVTGTDALGCSNTATLDVIVTNCSGAPQLTPASCGSILTALDQYVYFNSVPGATNYKLEIINDQQPFSTINVRNQGSLSSFKMSWIPGIQYGRTYKIRVSAYVNSLWSSWGTMCTVTTPSIIPTTQFNTCGVTLSALDQTLSFNPVVGATNYRMEIINAAQPFNVVNVRYNSVTNFKLSWVSGIQFNRTYDIKISAYVSGSWQPYGSSCSVTTPSTIPTTQLNTSSCGMTVLALNQKFNWNPVTGATKYKVEIINTAQPFNVVNFRTNNLTSFALSYVSGTTAGRTYDIRVAPNVGGVWGDYGTMCQVTVAPPAFINNTDNDEMRARMISQANHQHEQVFVNIYPNPNNGVFTIDLSADREIEISNILGERIMIKLLPEGHHPIDMNDQPAGIYFVKINSADKQQVIKIIKEN